MFGGLLQRLPQLWPADEGNVEPAQVVLLQLPGQRACPNTKARDLLCPGKKEKVVELLSELRKEAYLVAYMPESPDTTPEEASRYIRTGPTVWFKMVTWLSADTPPSAGWYSTLAHCTVAGR